MNSMAILFVCMYVYMSSTDRGQCACVPAQRANVAGLASSARCARPQMLCILLVVESWGGGGGYFLQGRRGIGDCVICLGGGD